MEPKKSSKSILDPKNNPKTEQELMAASPRHKSQRYTSSQPLSQDYQDYINPYHQNTSLYAISKGNKLTIYDTGSETKEVKILDTKESLDSCKCITKLPNGGLFCCGGNKYYGIAGIINSSYEVNIIPPGMFRGLSSCIYFENNVYCFGGLKTNINSMDISCKFDLNQNRWTNLTQMPNNDVLCHCAVFGRNILICGLFNTNILIYSIDIDSFSTIPYDFERMKRKILINSEKLYVIECSHGLIYESETGDEYSLKQISNSLIDNNPCQVDWTYNKDAIYIVTTEIYFKFDMNQKVMTRL